MLCLTFFLRNIIIFLLFASFCSLQKTIDRYRTYTRENVNNKTVQQDIRVKFSLYSMYDLPCFDHDRHELQGWWDVFIRKILNLLIISDSITFHVADVSTKHIFWLLHLHLNTANLKVNLHDSFYIYKPQRRCWHA